MSVEQTLNECLLMHPSIFPNQLSVYLHWFIVNGNGYEWVNGELVSTTEEKVFDLQQVVDKYFDFYMSDDRLLTTGLKYSRDALKDCIKSMFRLKTRNIDFSVNTIKKENNGYFKMYPICKYAKILNVPEDVQPDWRKAANKMYDWLMRHRDLLTESDLKYLENVKNLD
jgi:hypothetical protein